MKLNLGCGTTWKQTDWTGLEVKLGYDLNKKLLTEFRNDIVDLIFFSHTLEHLPWKSIPPILKDCYRVLKPGGTMRIIVPDIDKLWFILKNDRKDILVKGNPIYYNVNERNERPLIIDIQEQIGYSESPERFLSTPYGHNSFFNFSLLGIFLKIAGFSTIYKSNYRKSKVPEMKKPAILGNDGMPTEGFDNSVVECISLYAECVK